MILLPEEEEGKRERKEEDEENKNTKTSIKDFQRTRRMKSSKHPDKHSENEMNEKEVPTRDRIVT